MFTFRWCTVTGPGLAKTLDGLIYSFEYGACKGHWIRTAVGAFRGQIFCVGRSLVRVARMDKNNHNFLRWTQLIMKEL
jgi:hypothetical protein